MSYLLKLNSPRFLTDPTAMNGVLIIGVNELDVGATGMLNCTSYLCLCCRNPR